MLTFAIWRRLTVARYGTGYRRRIATTYTVLGKDPNSKLG